MITLILWLTILLVWFYTCTSSNPAISQETPKRSKSQLHAPAKGFAEGVHESDLTKNYYRFANVDVQQQSLPYVLWSLKNTCPIFFKGLGYPDRREESPPITKTAIFLILLSKKKLQLLRHFCKDGLKMNKLVFASQQKQTTTDSKSTVQSLPQTPHKRAQQISNYFVGKADKRIIKTLKRHRREAIEAEDLLNTTKLFSNNVSTTHILSTDVIYQNHSAVANVSNRNMSAVVMLTTQANEIYNDKNKSTPQDGSSTVVSSLKTYPTMNADSHNTTGTKADTNSFITETTSSNIISEDWSQNLVGEKWKTNNGTMVWQSQNGCHNTTSSFANNDKSSKFGMVEKKLNNYTKDCMNVAVRNHTEIKGEGALWNLNQIFSRYVGLPLLIVGTIGNCLSFAIMSKKSMRSNSVSFYTAYLAVFDLIYLWACISSYVLDAYTSWDMKQLLGGSLWLVIVYADSYCCVYTLVAMSIDRFIAVYYPLKAASWCTLKRARINIIVIITCALLLSTHFFLVTESETTAFGLLPTKALVDGVIYFFYNVQSVMDLLLYYGIPLCFIAVLNILIVVRIRQSTKERNLRKAVGGLHSSHPHQSEVKDGGGMTGSRLNKIANTVKRIDIRMSIICVLVSLAYGILVTPAGVFQLIYIVFMYQDVNTSDEVKTVIATGIMVSNAGVAVNSCINFFLYCMSGQKFRDELKTFFCKKRKLDHDQTAPRAIGTFPTSSTLASISGALEQGVQNKQIV